MPNTQTTRYDQPAQAQFMQTYIPIPFSEILQAGQSKQHAYDTNRMGFEQSIAESQNLDYIPNSQDENYITNVKSTLEDIRDKYVDKDYSDSEVVRQLYNEVRKNPNISRDRIEKIQRSAKGYREYQQLTAKSKAEGRSLFKEFDPTGYDTYSRGIFNQQPEALHNYAAKEETYFNNRETDMYTDPKTGRMYEYRNAKLLNDIATESAEDYARSTEGEQKIRGYRENTGDIKTSNKDLAYKFLQERSEEFKTHKYRGQDPMYKEGSGQERTVVPKTSIELDLPNTGTPFNSVKEVLESMKTPEGKTIAESYYYNQTYNQLKDKNLDNFREIINSNLTKNNKSLSNVDKDKLTEVVLDLAIKRSFDTPWYEKSFQNITSTAAKEMFENTSDKSLQELINKNKGYLNEAYDAIEDDTDLLQKVVETKFNEIRSKGTEEKAYYLPTTTQEGKIQISGTNDFVYSASKAIKDDFESNPFKFDFEPAGGQYQKDRKLSKSKDVLKDATSFEWVGANPTDIVKGTPYLVANAFKKDTDGNKEALGTFKVYMKSPTQVHAIARDYAMDGQMETAFRFENYKNLQDIESMFIGASANIKNPPIDRNVGKDFKVLGETITAKSNANGNIDLYHKGQKITGLSNLPAIPEQLKIAYKLLYEDGIEEELNKREQSKQ